MEAPLLELTMLSDIHFLLIHSNSITYIHDTVCCIHKIAAAYMGVVDCAQLGIQCLAIVGHSFLVRV